MDALLNNEHQLLKINQKTTFYNHSNQTLDTIYFLNWSNSFKHKNTPLGKRLIEDYDKTFHFSRQKDKGYTSIKSITQNNDSVYWNIPKKKLDIIKIALKNPLLPKDSAIINTEYLVKFPNEKFTNYGVKENIYNLRYWHLVPAVFDGKWQTFSNLNMDDLFMSPTDYKINLKLVEGQILNTDLDVTKTTKPPYTTFTLTGKGRVDPELNITIENDFKEFKTNKIDVITNLEGKSISDDIKASVLNRQINFIEEFLGEYPHKKLLINKVTYDKNPIYGLNQLPKILNPFTGIFEWDIKIFKALSKKYIDNTLLLNKREDFWLADGIQTLLMLKYVEKYYPEVTAMGSISKIWFVRTYNIAKLNFNGKYPLVYQFSARRNIDQALTTRSDSLSNFNRKIVNKYKAGIGLRYLDEYLQDSILTNSLKEFYENNKLQLSSSESFKKIISSKTDKNLDWFFNDYVKTKKKIDYTITKLKKNKDSVTITIKNKRNFTAPIALYGVNKKKETVFKKWLSNIDTTKTITLPRGDYNKVSLNYDYLYPEFNLRNNWKKVTGIFNRPIQLRFFKDLENPNYNQMFYNLYVGYNYYDGIILGPKLYNEAFLEKNFIYDIMPTYGLKSNNIGGSFSLAYQYLPENSAIRRYGFGIGGSSNEFAPGLAYQTLTPYAYIQFKRKSLRDAGGKSLIARYLIIDKDIDPKNLVENPEKANEPNKYNIFNLRYGFSDPNIIKDLRYTTDFQLAKNFSKISIDFRYRKLTDRNRQYDLRLFAGTFLHNKTDGNFYSFSLNRPNDYLFDYNYLGRSESSGFFSQQIIIAEGGFKSQFENNFANQWLVTTNASFSIWRWFEIYGDAGFYKSKYSDSQFKYDSGVRLNFIHEILEVYFPIQSSLGFEPSQKDYHTKIRFVLTISPGRIYNFLKRGFY